MLEEVYIRSLMAKSVANRYVTSCNVHEKEHTTLRDHHSDDGSSSESDFEYVGPGENSLLSVRRGDSIRGSSDCSQSVQCGEVMEKRAPPQIHDCSSTVVDCDFKRVGCDVRLPRREMALHLAEAQVLHLSLQARRFEEQLNLLKTENETLRTKYDQLEEKCKYLELKVDELLLDHQNGDSVCTKVNDGIMAQGASKSGNRNTRKIASESTRYSKLHTKMSTDTKRDVYIDGGDYINADEMPKPRVEVEDGLEIFDYSYVSTKHLIQASSRTSRKSSTEISPVMHIKLVMNNFDEHRRSKDQWVSQPFFTHERGYKMCLKVTANGQGDGEGSHITAVVYLMKGEFDNQLDWPFKGDITITLLNQEEDGGHFSRTIQGVKGDRRPVSKRITDEKFISAWGIFQFKAHDELRPKFLKSDSLKFSITTVIYRKPVSSPHAQTVRTEV